GFDLCKKIREESNKPIIILSARGESDDKVKGIDLGADDYLSKPFEARELVARIHGLLRRLQKDSDKNPDQIFKVDQQRLEVSLNGAILDLTTKEFELMDLFIKSPGVIFSRDEIIKEIKGIDAHLFSRSIDILISRLRHKIEDDPKDPQLIKTIWGKGYMFVDSR
ncbi:MAG: response regulator transcription factor, partial [Gammaproteobacteria bacterium]|nr:response regulator transcription factor [Gammaproteobacteria bacterium]